jgi:hypothetical protein
MHHQFIPAVHPDTPVFTLSFLRPALALLVVWLAPAIGYAQQRPLVTEDPETIGAGRVLLEGGFDYSWGVTYPASGLSGDLLRVPLFGASVGVSSIAEVQIDGGLYNRLTIEERTAAQLGGVVTASGDSTSSVEDLVIGTKLRLAAETSSRPSIGFRFATRLPNASNESGIGLDTTDFHASVLVAKTVESVRLVGNVGLGILGDPTRGDRQNDVLTYGTSFVRAISQGAEVVGEINGRISTRSGVPPPGTESRSVLRFGGRYTTGSLRGDAAVLVGLTGRDPDLGITAGFTYVFDAFTIP